MVIAVICLSGCSDGKPKSETKPTAGNGKLQFRANGEDFVRQGFISKDSWQISFDRVYINLADVTAYQANPPYNPDKVKEISVEEKIILPNPKTIDLAEGGEDAEPILIAEIADAPTGHYNALSWKIVKANTGPAMGQTLVMGGKASKQGQTIDFVIKLDQEIEYRCGEFVGDQRKGILAKDGEADIEATFHFDHIFGDSDVTANDPLNTGAIGFEPLAALAKNGKLEVTMAQLKSGLPAGTYQQLTQEILPNLGHVGEGHCKSTPISRS
ncbi:MAG: DUF4382 domain-containing protein [Moorea sp. SIO1F2]|uniref:DUF4382 domain-containing protein n=1 Tax=unclassified Moorena TaxID=2683338 RepID=UPI0013B86320|nr:MULTISPECIES: DUF4382 domain-containing protein [unclassified Moorena]NEN96936.1 DUF4382 domain-containing protein [Moorena sp. SIO3I7]NEO07746.1 DUF4382 domain-containing protein [Moorena sp. SIO3I8]NEP24641.1 DUF4382 domain-containing protein [Moorena sp. SIO3I6]NEQ58900.1 DUF4382 domain-containing protein [Moorena sp. SIO4A1]NET81058.1 DUF4382 domain-containing protein [Moorena sp. SIO1F2]